MENLENIQNIVDSPESLESHDEIASPVTEPAAPAPSSDADLSRLIAEAEQRGYLRGRNEQIEATVMKQPDDLCAAPSAGQDDCYPGFLSHIRPDFWD